MAGAALAFPASKMREIATADPDVKDIPKQSIELLRNAAEIFTQSLIAKCFDEARRRKRQTANLKDFMAVVSKDDVLSAMLGQFIGADSHSNDEGPPVEEDVQEVEEIEKPLEEEEEAASKEDVIESILDGKLDSSNSDQASGLEDSD
jgi:hypothetical protein